MATQWIDENLRQEFSGVWKQFLSWWRRAAAATEMRTGDFVQHAHSEHNQEADESAKESRKSRRTKEMNRKWKATVGWWDGSAKEDGRCKCGVVITGAETDGWVTISESAVPKKKSAAPWQPNFFGEQFDRSW